MKKDVYILSGFLGSGKTTLLKKLIQELKGQSKKPAILMNELGKISIDSQEVEEETPLKELLDGCICCTIQEKVESQLQELLWNEEFDVLIIETTGAAHPVEVVDSILSPLFADKFAFKGILTVVDCLQWKERANLGPQILHLMREQIRHAHYIILNKVDLLSEMEVGSIVYEIQQLNRDARLYMTNYCDINMKDLLQLSVKQTNSPKERAAIGEQLLLKAIVHTFTDSISSVEFEEWLQKLPSTVYRIKGYVPFKGKKYPTLFQYSYGMPIFIPEEIKVPTNLVLIGENLNEEEVITSLKKLEER